MDLIEKARSAIVGAGAARDQNDSDTSMVYLAIADRAALEAERAIADVRADAQAIRGELARRNGALFAGARMEKKP